MADTQTQPPIIQTGTDHFGSRWGVNDRVTRLRMWATDLIYELPNPQREMIVGSAEDCSIHLADRLVSRAHVRLTGIEQGWFAQDISKNGTLVDSVRTSAFALEPGIEMRVGSSTLVAESARFIELRAFIGRILGWTTSRLEAVDLALRAIRHAALRRSTLYLEGETDLVAVARSLHRHVWGPHLPFVVCDPRRGDADESVRSAANKPTGMEAYAAAAGGTMCVRSHRLPPDFAKLRRHLRDPGSNVLLVVVGDGGSERRAADIAPDPAISIPGLGDRASELPMVIEQYALDAAHELCLPPVGLSLEDFKWVLEHGATSLSEIEKATMRLTALRASRSLADAANRLRMAPVSLTRWLGRRTLPPSLEQKIRSSDA